MSRKPTDEEKRQTLLWDGIGAIVVLIVVFVWKLLFS
jgi:preprotein translocase subunit Sss1